MILLLSQIHVWNTVRLRKHLNRTRTGTEPSSGVGFLIFRQKCVRLKNPLFTPSHQPEWNVATLVHFIILIWWWDYVEAGGPVSGWFWWFWWGWWCWYDLWPVVSDLCGTRTGNIHPKHILQTQSSVLVPELNPAVGSVYKAGSTVISSFIVVDTSEIFNCFIWWCNLYSSTLGTGWCRPTTGSVTGAAAGPAAGAVNNSFMLLDWLKHKQAESMLPVNVERISRMCCNSICSFMSSCSRSSQV